MSDNNKKSNTEPVKNKDFPVTTPQVAGMFGMPLSGSHIKDSSLPGAPGASVDPKLVSPMAMPANLPINLPVVDKIISNGIHFDSHSLPTEPVSSLGDNKFLAFAKNLVPYVIVFSVSIFLYFFFFSKINLSGMFTSKAQVQAPKQSALAQLETQNLTGYQTWISGFYFDVSDKSLLDPEADNSGNGLSNFQKYLLNLNPKSYDSLGLGMADSQALESGINPLSGNKLTDSQKAIVDKYFDFEVISNRLALAKLQHSGQVAGAEISQNGIIPPIINNQAGNNGSNQGANNQVITTTPVAEQVPPASNLNLNTNTQAHLDIPSLKISAPLIWTGDTKNFDKDLQNGVVHYPGTALPGDIGTTYISGHSSNYAWAKGNYNHVFTHLGDLADNSSFSITVPQNGGKDVIFHYVVVGRQQYSPTDQAQFKNTGKSVVALSTCWPVGSTAKRLVVFGELTQIEK